MPTKRQSTSSDAYQIKITLRGSKPPIWRRFVVPGNITLQTLHEVIQAVMGWYDCHLHSFEIDGEEFTQLTRDGEWLEMEGRDERKFRLEDVVRAAGKKFHYTYDFGDDWHHTLLVEKIIPPLEMPDTFVCLAGKGRRPPEDCGGIWGYYRLLEILRNPNDPEHSDMKEWAGGEINPEKFDRAEINAALAHFRK